MVATVVSLIGWMATHYHSAEPTVMIVAMILALVLVYGIAVVNIKAFQKIDELEDL